MRKFLSRTTTKESQPFGKLGFIGVKQMDEPIINVINFSKDNIEELENVSIDTLKASISNGQQTWINVAGLHDLKFITGIADILQFHPIVIDKITNTGQRPSFEEYDDYLVLTLKQFHMNLEELLVQSKHIVFVLKGNTLITFQENLNDPFDVIRKRLQNKENRVRSANVDYLMFALVRSIIHEYKFVIEHIGDKIENLESDIFSRPSVEMLEKLNSYKSEANYISKMVRPAKDSIIQLCKSDHEFIDSDRVEYVANNVLDYTMMVTDSIEYFRNMLNDQLDIYHTNISSRLNEMFRVLTVFSVVFVPLTFIAGIYGMNFEIIPELTHPHGYFYAWATMILLAITMIFYFKRKGWL